MGKNKIRQFLLKYLSITAGCVLYAIAVSFFLDPNGIVPGGFTGLAMVLGEFIPLATGTLTMVLNIPVIILGIIKFGGRFLASSIYAVVVSSVLVDIFAIWGPLSRDPLLCALAGGVLMAIGLELVLKEGATTGGTDIVVKLLRTKLKHFSTGTLFTVTDGLIVIASALIFRNVEIALYAIITIVVYSKIIDLILYGRDEAKMFMIISENHEAITKRLLTELDAGATILEATGAYSGSPKPTVMCVIRKHMAPKAMKVIRQEDPTAFTIITTANEVFGEGYKDHKQENVI